MPPDHPSTWEHCEPGQRKKGCECATCAPERYSMLPGLDAPEAPVIDLKKRRAG